MKKLLVASMLLAISSVPVLAADKALDQARAEKERNRKTEAILKSKVISVDFKDAAIGDVMKFLQATVGVNIVVDPEISKEFSEEDLRVTLKVDELPAMSVLNLILKFKKLGHAFRFGVLVITTIEKSQGDVTMRIYDVNDLSLPLKDFIGPDFELKTGDSAFRNPFPPDEEEVKNYSPEEIVEMIRDQTGDGSWTENPRCKITIVRGMLIVVQSAKVHNEINKLLNSLRAAR